MSLILDALKRSERARRVLGATQSPPPPEAAAPSRRGWVLGAVLLLLLVNAALLAWFGWGPGAAPDAAPPLAPQGEVRSLAREADGAGAVADPLADPPSSAVYAAPATAATPLAEAPPALRARLAALHVDVHGWADDPAQRFVLINLKRRVVGDALDGGATLVEIVPDGAVVELDGRRVLLPRQ
jgi:general secretion pathway protein B